MFVDRINAPYYYGNYRSWDEACVAAEQELPGGYSCDAILQRVSSAIQMVRRGEAAYERDGVVFPRLEFRKSLVAAMLYIADHMQGQLRILDFGGALGSTYWQNHEVMELFSINFQSHIVEQDLFVEYGKKYVPECSFYNEINKVDVNFIDAAMISASINYTDKPYTYLERLLALQLPYFIVDRTMFNIADFDRLVVETVPENIYRAVYPCWLLHEEKFMDLLRRYGYRVVFDIVNDIDGLPLVEENSAFRVPFKGWLFVR